LTWVPVCSAHNRLATHLWDTMSYTTGEATQAGKWEASQHHSWFGRHCTQSGHGFFADRGGRGIPCKARPLRARTRSTVDGETHTRSV